MSTSWSRCIHGWSRSWSNLHMDSDSLDPIFLNPSPHVSVEIPCKLPFLPTPPPFIKGL